METLACAAPLANSIRPVTAMKKERILPWSPNLELLAPTAAPLTVPGSHYARNPTLVPVQPPASLTLRRAPAWRRRGRIRDVVVFRVAAAPLLLRVLDERGTQGSRQRYRGAPRRRCDRPKESR